jgi:hypothetical protein
LFGRVSRRLCRRTGGAQAAHRRHTGHRRRHSFFGSRLAPCWRWPRPEPITWPVGLISDPFFLRAVIYAPPPPHNFPPVPIDSSEHPQAVPLQPPCFASSRRSSHFISWRSINHL